MSTEKFAIGDKVVDRYGRRGEVYAVYPTFAGVPFLTMQPDEWLEAQDIPFTEAQINEVWYGVECDGGAIQSPESLLEPS